MEKVDTHFTPHMVITHAIESRGLKVEQLGVTPVVVLAWSVKAIRSLADATGAILSEHWIYGERHPLYTGTVAGRPFTLAHVPVGAPGTVMMMEEMVACGARVFWGFGTGGSLQEKVPIGTCIIATSAISEEGTSRHYVGENTPLVPDSRLVTIAEQSCTAEGVTSVRGAVWTTDAPYRETRAKIESYCQQGVLGVDMETSAMYGFGQVRGVKVCNLLVVSDELFREWRFGIAPFVETRRQAEKSILRCVSATAV